MTWETIKRNQKECYTIKGHSKNLKRGVSRNCGTIIQISANI